MATSIYGSEVLALNLAVFDECNAINVDERTYCWGEDGEDEDLEYCVP